MRLKITGVKRHEEVTDLGGPEPFTKVSYQVTASLLLDERTETTDSLSLLGSLWEPT